MREAWARKTKRDETQRERDDRARALRAAREEAEGAGIGRFTFWVTTTVTDATDLPAAIADVEQRAGRRNSVCGACAELRPPVLPQALASVSTRPTLLDCAEVKT